mmetsp:Transcript_11437/g.20182  ORF Transcript_11437/g.20182 Transcript_11437/m.20182 type:complete len:216 (+) Transcript_11437:478-1125(+)
MLMPSRSTTFTPSLKMDSSRLAMPSSSRLISSTYRMPRWASASRPGWNTVRPSFMEASMSTVPTNLSSVTPSGICTKGAVRSLTTSSCPASFSARPASHARGSSGSALQKLPSTTSMGGSRAWSPLAMTDLAVPLRPAMAMPPSPVSTAPNSSACLIKSWPTTAASGMVRPLAICPPASPSNPTAAAAARATASGGAGLASAAIALVTTCCTRCW